MKKLLPVLIATTTVPAFAAPPQVVTDIAPVHSLVQQVLGELGQAELLVEQGTDPHHANLRPSQAAALQSAGVMFWIGEAMTPWLEDGVDSLGENAIAIELLEVEGTKVIEVEEEDHDDHGDEKDHADHDDHGDEKDHADHDDHGDEKEHADHDDHDHEKEHADHDDHDDEEKHADADGHDDHAGHDHHDHGGVDPHAWLDPANGIVWLGAIAETLGELDPENAATYEANAAAGVASLEALIKEIEARDLPHNIPAVPAHNFLGYYEDRFHYHPMLPLKDLEGNSAEASAVSKLQEMAQNGTVKCFFYEAGEDATSYAAFESDLGLQLIEIDQLGANFDLGPALYGDVIRSVTDSLAACES